MGTVAESRRLADGLDPDAVNYACTAYDKAITILRMDGAPECSELIAQRVMIFARAGVTDPDQLCRLALIGLVIRKE